MPKLPPYLWGAPPLDAHHNSHAHHFLGNAPLIFYLNARTNFLQIVSEEIGIGVTNFNFHSKKIKIIQTKMPHEYPKNLTKNTIILPFNEIFPLY